MIWRAEQDPCGTGRIMYTSGPFVVRSWIDEGTRGGEFLRYDLSDAGFYLQSFTTLAAAKQYASSVVESVADVETRSVLYALGAEVQA